MNRLPCLSVRFEPGFYPSGFEISTNPRAALKALPRTYHVVRLIRSDRKLDIFGESFRVPVDAVYEYVWATIDVKKQCLSLYVGDELLKQQDYRVR